MLILVKWNNFQLLQLGVSILIGAPTYGVLEQMHLKKENNKTFLVNVKWLGRVNVLVPKGTPQKYNRTLVRIFGHILLYYIWSAMGI